MINCIIGAKGGVGASTIAQYKAYEASKKGETLLIDGSFKHRSQDLLNPLEDLVAYDFYDFLSEIIDIEDCLVRVADRFDLVCASPCHSIKEIDPMYFKKKMDQLKEKYDYILVDLSNWWIDDLVYWSSVGSIFTFISTTEKLSFRGLDQLKYICFREKIRPQTYVIFNKLRKKEEKKRIETWNLDYEFSIIGYILYQELDENIFPILKEGSIKDDIERLNFTKQRKGLFGFIQGGSNGKFK